MLLQLLLLVPAAAQEAVSYSLTVEVVGDSPGTVTRSEPGSACDPDVPMCAAYPEGTSVTLTAVPGPGSEFAGWGMNVPAGCSTEPYPLDCVVTVDADKTVQAAFVAAGGGAPAPVAHYPLDETSGEVINDTSGNGNNGTYGGGPTLGSAGRIDAAVGFSGITADHGVVPRSIGDDFSIEFWMNTSQVTGGDQGNWYNGAGLVDGEVSGVSNDFGTSLMSGKVAFGTGAPDVTVHSTTTVNDGTWHHVVATREMATGAIKIYVDGVLEDSDTAGTQTLNAFSNLALGRLQPGHSDYDGLLDDVKLYDAVLTAAQIANNYENAGGTVEPPADPQLTVIVEGPGSVSSAPAGIDACDSTADAEACTGTFPADSEVTLTATPTGDATFLDWTVAEDGTACTGTGPCTLTMAADRTVTATFEAAVVEPTDTDGDGVNDDADQCDAARGPAWNDGCPADRVIDTNSAIDSITITPTLNCASTFNGARMFYGDTACGTFLAVDGQAVFGPGSIPAGPDPTPWTPWRQEQVTGTGTAGDPYTVVTEVVAGTTGIHLVQTDTYVEGAEEIATSLQLVNTDDAQHEVVLYRAADCYFQGSDAGFGNFVAASEAIGCREVTSGAPGDLVLEWEPGDAANSNYFESSYSAVWSGITAMTPFPDTCAQCPNQVDNGAGLSWSATLASDGAAGDEATRSHVVRIVERAVTAGEIPGDQDVDGVPDADDLCPTEGGDDVDENGCPPNDDGDGIAPQSDNCPHTYNLTQDDWDEDGVGDACDVVASIEDYESTAEGHTAGTGLELWVPVTLEEPAVGDVTLTFETVEGSADATDFTPIADGVVTITDGDIMGYARVQLLGDTLVEGSEDFSIVLTNPDMQYVDDEGVVTITDDETSCEPGLDGTLHIYGGFNDVVDVRRSGDDIVVSAASLPAQTCAVMSEVDKIFVHGFQDPTMSYPSTQALISSAGGSFAPGATAEATGLSELEIEAEHLSRLEFVGTADNDDIRIGTAGIALNGDKDADVLMTGVSSLAVTGGEGADRIYATGGAGSGSTATTRVVLTGGPGPDRLTGGSGVDDLYGGDGNDTMMGGAGADWMFGNAGADTVTYADHWYGDISVTLVDENNADAVASDTSNDGYVDSAGNSTEFDKAIAEHVIGGGGNDRLFGTDVANNLTGGHGYDTLFGYAGGDSLTAGAGGGVLYGYDGKDRLIGGSGSDVMWGDAGHDQLYGYAGEDDLYPGAGVDFVSGGTEWDDVFYPDAPAGIGIDLGYGVGTMGIADDDMYVGAEEFWGSEYGDTLIGSGDPDRLHGLGGPDWIYGGGGSDFLFGGEGNDNLVGEDGLDDLYGEGGDDVFQEGAAANGSDDFIGDAGFDQVVYSYRTSPTPHTNGDGSALMDGSIAINGVVVAVDGAFNDGAPNEQDRVRTDIETVWGTTFNDKMVGQAAKDVFWGDTGQDVLEGGGGNDELNGEEGGDTLRGGAGNDVIGAGVGNDDVYGDAGHDDLYGHDGTDFIYGGLNDDDIFGHGAYDDLHGDAGNDVIYGGIGNDDIYGDAGADDLYGEDGNDFFGEGNAANGSDDIVGGPGEDGVDYGARPATQQLRLSLDNNTFDDGAYSLTGTPLENDNLRLSIENVQAGAGGDLLWGNGLPNRMWGGGGADQLVGYGGIDKLDGQSGDDNIWAGTGNDFLWGGTGKDHLDGEAGYDEISGGGGTQDTCLGEFEIECELN